MSRTKKPASPFSYLRVLWTGRRPTYSAGAYRADARSDDGHFSA